MGYGYSMGCVYVSSLLVYIYFKLFIENMNLSCVPESLRLQKEEH